MKISFKSREFYCSSIFGVLKFHLYNLSCFFSTSSSNDSWKYLVGDGSLDEKKSFCIFFLHILFRFLLDWSLNLLSTFVFIVFLFKLFFYYLLKISWDQEGLYFDASIVIVLTFKMVITLGCLCSSLYSYDDFMFFYFSNLIWNLTKNSYDNNYVSLNKIIEFDKKNGKEMELLLDLAKINSARSNTTWS